jgi:DNA-binding transcriptional MocR family regulator
MTIWQPDLTERPGPRYRVLAEAIAQDIGEGRLAAGTRLPPQRDLAFRLGVTVGTVSRAYALAEQRGLIAGTVGRGTFVRAHAPEALRNPVIDGSEALIRLTVNAPPDQTVCGKVATSLAGLAAEPELCGALLAYGPRAGHAVHRAAAAAWLAGLGLPDAPEQILLTGGAHQAIQVALVGLARPGDLVLTEALGYGGLGNIALRFGFRLEGLPLDEEGLAPASFEAAARTGRARVVLLNPTVHNPTTVTMGQARREAIVAIARRHDLVLIEDDVYGLLPPHRPPPLAVLAPERTVYVASASKSIAPGLRLGIVQAPPDLLPPITDAQHDLFAVCPPLMAELFRRWQADGAAAALAAANRAEAIARQQLAAAILRPRSYQAEPCSYHLWLPLPPPWRTTEFVAALRTQGVAIDPGFAFAHDRSAAPHAVRVSLSAAASQARLRHALERIAATLATPPDRRRETI